MAGGRNGSWKDTALSIKVKKKLINKGMTITDLAKEIEVNQSYLSQVLYGIKPGEECIKKVILALDIKDGRQRVSGE